MSLLDWINPEDEKSNNKKIINLIEQNFCNVKSDQNDKLLDWINPEDEKSNNKIIINQIYQNFCYVKLPQDDKSEEVIKLLNADVYTCTCSEFRKLLVSSKSKRCRHIREALSRGFFKPENIPLEIVEQKICLRCFSNKFKKSGFRKVLDGSKRQRYRCLECGFRQIFGENGFRKMKNTPQNIVEALSLFFRGVSFRDIAAHLSETKDLRISHTTVQNWYIKYTELINSFLEDILRPYFSEVWSLDEMNINVKNTQKTGKGFYAWLWSIIDPKTKVIHGSVVSKKRSIVDARKIIATGKKTTGTLPSYIITDSLSGYKKAILRECGISKVAHIQTKSLVNGFENRPIERLHNEIRSVIKSNRGFGNDKSAQRYFDSYKSFHNFIRPHTGLPNKQTPAEACGMDLKLGTNKIMGLIKKSTEPEHKFAMSLGWRIDKVDIKNEGDYFRVTPKCWIDKKVWIEINDILRLDKFYWLNNDNEKGCWIRLKKQTSLMEFCN